MHNGQKRKAWFATALCLSLAGTVWAQQAAACPRDQRKRPPKPVAMTVLGPEQVPAGTNVLYTANIRYDNATTRIVDPVWAIAGDVTAARIGADGALSVNPLSENASIEVVACFTDGGTAIAGTLDVTLLAPSPKTADVSEVEVRPRHPWNGWVDIAYTLETDPPGTVAMVVLSAYDHEQGRPLPAKTLAGDGARGSLVTPGRHRLSWNLGTDHPDVPASRVDITLEAFPSVPAAAPCGGKCRQGGLHASFYDLGGPNPEASPWKSRYKDMMAFFGARQAALVTNTAYLGNTFDFGYTERGTCRFPGKYAISTTEAFAVLFEGQIDLPEDGTYTFGSLSDDGVSLYIDRKRVYETTKRQNFGDGMSSGSIALKAGLHDIAIAYYEGGGQQGLQMYWQTPSDAGPVLLPQSVLCGPAGQESGCQGLYLVVDLSGGPYAKRWPVKFLDAAPAGGFNTAEYKTKKLVLRRIEAGSFTMGSPPDELGRYVNEDLHPVTLTKPYYIGLFEMTQRQWELAMGSNPSQDIGPMRPVECTSYDDIRGRDAGSRWPADNAVDPGSLVGKLRAKTGLPFDLPTDAQWEHACRAGTQTALYTGANLADTRHDPAVDQIARYGYDNGTHGGIQDGKGGYPTRHTTVGSYRPNAWGLYDMGGNVWELCRDWYALYLGPSAATDPAGPPSGQERVRRGGAWDNSAWHCRSASRDHFGPSDPAFANGFRLACETE